MKRFLILGSIAALVSVSPVQAGSPSDPEVVDGVGDANGLSPADGIDARPASFDEFDLLSVWFETTYETQKQRDSQGKVVAVDYIARGLRVSIETLAPKALPPALQPASDAVDDTWYRVGVSGLPCASTFGFFSLYEYPKRRAYFSWGCGALVEASDLARAGATDSFTVPLGDSSKLQVGTRLAAPSATSGLTLEGHPAVGPVARTLDSTRSGTDFVIGQDVPSRVLCAEQPEHIDCS